MSLKIWGLIMNVFRFNFNVVCNKNNKPVFKNYTMFKGVYTTVYIHNTIKMKVPHSPLTCLWREWIRPLLFNGCKMVCNKPTVRCWDCYDAVTTNSNNDRVVDTNMCESMLSYVMDNIEDFEEWLIINKGKLSSKHLTSTHIQTGMSTWQKYIEKNTVCAPTPGPLITIIVVAVPIIISGTVGGLVMLGLDNLIQNYIT